MSPNAPLPEVPPDDGAARLRLSPSLAAVPPERPQRMPDAGGAAAALREASASGSAGLVPLTVGLGGIALLTSLGWLLERRRRREEEDSVLWADVQPAASSLVTRADSLDDILPEGRSAAESARAIYVTAVGETTSRREATLIDLQQLDKRLGRRRERGDRNAAVLLLQQHLVDFRYTSPWVFLELRELYLELDLQSQWDMARDTFKARFGQNAPAWTAPSTANAEMLDDAQLCEGIASVWPQRPARMWMLHWMLGEHDMRIKAMGPPLLPLGVYRDLMVLDKLLDEVMPSSTAYHDTI